MTGLFSDGDRDSTTPRLAESQFEFLDRVAGDYWDEVRRLMDLWFERMCSDAQSDVRGRLNSPSSTDFTGALWELLLHASLTALGFEVECHPELPGTSKRVDFLVTGSEECTFYLEAKALGPDQDDSNRESRRRQVYDALNERVSSDKVFLSVDFDREGDQQIPYAKLGSDVQRWIDSELDLNALRAATAVGGPLAGEGYTWEDESRSGWVVTVTPIPKSEPRPGDRIVALMGGDAAFIDDRTPIRKALDKKAHRYGTELDRPLVVALAIDRPFADRTDVADALFGDEVVHVAIDSDDFEVARRPNGLWLGPAGPRGKRLSAVLIGSDVTPWSIPRIPLHLWEHPEADRPISCNLQYIDRYALNEATGLMELARASRPLGELHGLRSGWPPGDAFPHR
jgi:hypothetical protein